MSKHLSNTKFIIAITIVMLIFSAFMIMPDAEEAATDPGEGWSECGDNLWYKLDGTILIVVAVAFYVIRSKRA